MQWSDAVRDLLAMLPRNIAIDMPVARRLYGLLDLTSLNDNDTEASVASFIEGARSALGHVAAVCIYPRFVSLTSFALSGSPVQIATVVNFPTGQTSLPEVLVEIGNAIQAGATEIDVVFPYQAYLAGDRAYAQSFVVACKAACGESVLLKVILETGALPDLATIANAAQDAITSGADFIKTSTGKISAGATLEAVAVMLLVVKHLEPEMGRPLGVKVSGGVREAEQAVQYLALADQILGNEHVSAANFRIGASQLAKALLAFA